MTEHPENQASSPSPDTYDLIDVLGCARELPLEGIDSFANLGPRSLKKQIPLQPYRCLDARCDSIPSTWQLVPIDILQRQIGTRAGFWLMEPIEISHYGGLK